MAHRFAKTSDREDTQAYRVDFPGKDLMHGNTETE
jgi:hypothetical protein